MADKGKEPNRCTQPNCEVCGANCDAHPYNRECYCFDCVFETRRRAETVPLPPLTDAPITYSHEFLTATTGVKNDSAKVRVDLLSVPALLGTSAVLTHGAVKYAARNWEKGIAFSRCYGAVLRHLWAWWQGEEIDQDSGLPHLDCAACEVMFLQQYRTNTKYVSFDDRPIERKESD